MTGRCNSLITPAVFVRCPVKEKCQSRKSHSRSAATILSVDGRFRRERGRLLSYLQTITYTPSLNRPCPQSVLSAILNSEWQVRGSSPNSLPWPLTSASCTERVYLIWGGDIIRVTCASRLFAQWKPRMLCWLRSQWEKGRVYGSVRLHFLSRLVNRVRLQGQAWTGLN